jgi:hypothetical protein
VPVADRRDAKASGSPREGERRTDEILRLKLNASESTIISTSLHFMEYVIETFVDCVILLFLIPVDIIGENEIREDVSQLSIILWCLSESGVRDIKIRDGEFLCNGS